LKALGALRLKHGIADAIRKCGCEAHKNEDYLSCPTSLPAFLNAVSCPPIEYPTLSSLDKQSISIKEQEDSNINASNEKENMKKIKGEISENRNTHREGPVRQKKQISLVSWGGLFTCHEKKCAYQKCDNCGIARFFNAANMCNAERNTNFTVKVRKYENIPGRTRGMQMEIIEVEMNGDELIQHLIGCAKAAIPHEWNIRWNTHARQMCINTYKEDTLNVMTDFSAVLDHDVQDRLNTAIPCHTNQCVVLASYSPSTVPVGNTIKRVQQNDVWHCWSGQGGVIEANSYYHSVVMRHILKHYAHLAIKQLNIFTDGCAEQYKSRRNAYFIAELAMEHQITVTHNYAPTASFKTMVDGQGDLVKSTYRTFEKNEVEGTRCPTSYHLFELFTSKYPLTPSPPIDSTRRLMTITGRMHRFLIDTVDATTIMRQRAATAGDVIITDYLNERWDAPVLKGIKGLFCLIGRAENSVPNLHSREHACFCNDCMTGNYSDCLHQSTTGILKAESVMRLPYKDAPARKAPAVGNILERINFLKERFTPENTEQTIVAIIVENVKENEEPFKLAMLTKPAKQLRKDYIYECKIDGSDNQITVSKGTWCVTLRFMECKAAENNEYIIPVKTKEIKMPLTSVYFPEDDNSSNDHFTIMYSVRSEEIMGQTHNYYSIRDESLEAIRLSMNVDAE
jgi:hypothetical protein